MRLIPIYFIFIPIITALLIYVVNKEKFNRIIFLSQITLSILAVVFLKKILNINEYIIKIGGWDSKIGISLKNDYLSISFIILTIFIWWMIIIYSFDKRKSDFKFLFFIMFLEGTFLGLIQTNDIFNMFIFIEITTIISTILIIYKKDGYSVRAGLYYLLFNSFGMIFYLLGMILIYVVSGSLNFDVISEKISLYSYKDFIKLSYIFLIASIGVKSAFFPVYNWLPKAHGAAPASISALLSGLLVKSGLYVFIRMNGIFNINSLNEFFFYIGFITATSGIIFALSQKDIKQILAFHTISQIGIILMGLSSNDTYSYYGGIFHIFNHALFKSLLFMGAGIIINVYETRRITEIKGVFKKLPLVSIFMIIGMLSITGAPFFNGYISKSMIKYGFKYNIFKYYLLQLINIGTGLSFIKFSQIFFDKSDFKVKTKLNQLIPLMILSIACIFLGIFYKTLTNEFFSLNITFINLFNIKAWINYLIIIIIGIILYKTVIEKDYKPFRIIRHLKISFETSSTMLVLFIFIMIIWSYYKV